MAISMTSMVARLESRAHVSISGREADEFLQAVISQDVTTRGACQYGLLLTPQGKLLYEFLFHRSSERFIFDCDACLRDEFVARLMVYRLRREVVIEPFDTKTYVVWRAESAVPSRDIFDPQMILADAQAFLPDADWMIDPREPRLGARAICVADAIEPTPSPAFVSEVLWHNHRIRCGVPEGGKEIPPGEIFPLEFGLDQLGAIDFHKGCYIGQEVTSRSYRRGARRKSLQVVRFDQAAPALGTPLMAETRRAGVLIARTTPPQDIHHIDPSVYAIALIRNDADIDALRADGQSFSLEGDDDC